MLVCCTDETYPPLPSPSWDRSLFLCHFLSDVGEDEFKHGETEKIRIGTDPETIRARDIQALKSRGMEWVPDESVSNCGICSSAFSVLSRRVRLQFLLVYLFWVNSMEYMLSQASVA